MGSVYTVQGAVVTLTDAGCGAGGSPLYPTHAFLTTWLESEYGHSDEAIN